MTRQDNDCDTHTILSPAITTAQRRPDQALPANHNGTAPPRPGSPHQSQRHGATQTRLSPPITTAQYHPPGSPHQSQRHSAAQTRLSPSTAQRHSQTRLSPPITTAQRHALPTNHNGTWTLTPKGRRHQGPQTHQGPPGGLEVSSRSDGKRATLLRPSHGWTGLRLCDDFL